MKTVKIWKEGKFPVPEIPNHLIEIESVSSMDSDEKPLLEEETCSSGGGDEISNDDLVEIDLGLKLVEKLDEIFGGKIFREEIKKNKEIPTKIFMSKSFGEELYALWLEQYYSKMEEEKFKSYKDDELLAKQIHNGENGPKEDKSPETLEEIMQMEAALQSYHNEVKEQTNEKAGDNWAAKMSREKLFELFPNVDRDFLVQILVSQNNNYKETVDILKDSLPEDWTKKMQSNTKLLIDKSQAELEKQVNSSQGYIKRRMEAENIAEIKKSLDEVRQQIEFHRNSKQVCINKARDAIQAGQYSTANYYTNMCNLHKVKIDSYNNKAAAYTADIHEFTQSDANVLDLHYLSLSEAIQSLDIYLDRNINKLRAAKKPYKEVFVITGRGKNSVGGIPAIKIRAKKRLFERKLRWVSCFSWIFQVFLKKFHDFSFVLLPGPLKIIQDFWR